MLSHSAQTWQIFSVSGHNTCTCCQEHLGPAPGQVKGTLGTISGPPLPSPRTSASSLDTCPPLLDLDTAVMLNVRGVPGCRWDNSLLWDLPKESSFWGQSISP